MVIYGEDFYRWVIFEGGGQRGIEGNIQRIGGLLWGKTCHREGRGR